MITNRSKPPGVIIPELAYDDVAVAAVWLCKAFGFRERLRIGDHRIQLLFEGASIVATERRDDTPTNHADHAVMVHVADVDAHHAMACAAGARIGRVPTDYPYGERQYDALDIGGHRWVFSQSMADVHPADWGGELLDVS
ncbi:glyoxalase [Dyella solisilvae]|uniref:Glyoxalase n=1 Tax=Dyella solisilvae TaxID=1920168 RepID=A0A370K5N4_9GAMM|nr:VOC family protein [Dyella solisilvae]RDI97962.1 glyoxalase [Dyella solisilvae]